MAYHGAQRTAGDRVQFGALVRRDLRLQGGEPRCEGGGLVLGDREVGGLLQQLGQADRPVAVQRRLDEVVLGDADRVDEHEARLLLRVRRDGLEVGVRDGAGAAALHLLEVLRRADVAHEEHALQRLDVGAGGDHVHGDGDAQRGAGAERRELAARRRGRV